MAEPAPHRRLAAIESWRAQPPQLWRQVTPISRRVLLGMVAGLSLSLVIAASVAVAGIRVQAPRRISLANPFSGPCTQADPNFTPGISVETSVAVDPRDARRILVSWIYSGSATDVVMASQDGGRTFSRVFIPGLSQCTGGSAPAASDPNVAFSSDGRVAYFSGAQASLLSLNPFTPAVGMVASRSLDGGLSWSAPYGIQPLSDFYWDKPILSVDPRRPGTAYYTFALRVGTDYTSGYSLLAKTSNAGQTWSNPVKLYDPHRSGVWPANSQILVNRDGSLLDVFVLASQGGAGPAQLMSMRSVNGGRSWSAPVRIGRSSGYPVNDPVTQNVIDTIGTVPSQTVALDGDVYAAWTQPGSTNRSSHIAVARSTNGGRTWRIYRLPVDGQSAFPAIAAAGDGTIGVAHYVVAAASRRGYWAARVVFDTSQDSGRHWTRRTLAGPFNVLTATGRIRGCCALGDYIGMAGLPRGLVTAYPMAKPVAVHKIDVYFTRITTTR